MTSSWPQALSKMVFFLVLLPATLTYFHLLHVQQRANLVFVGPVGRDIPLNSIHGMYQGISVDGGTSATVYSRVTPSKNKMAWPSIARVSTLLATPTSTLLRRNSLSTEEKEDYPTQIVYHDGKWCLESVDTQICSDPTTIEAIPSGIWTMNNGTTIGIQIASNQGASNEKNVNIDKSVPKKFRRNPNKQSRRNRNIEQVLLRPTTTLLLGVNVLLAFFYWNQATNPANVAKVYNKIKDGELWRAFTGATAHFEPLHLGFNMMALYSLGEELENSYGSIPFLFYNISLIPITTTIMMGMIYLRIRQTDNQALGETSSVGFSAVLFAWMVIASLERPETCPIPFMPDVCFSTHEIWKLKVNISPIVQLFVAQLIMKRVSFVGHLAGIVAGFALHWNLLPLELVQPAVLIPALHLVYLWHISHLIPVTRGGASDEDDDESTDEEMKSLTNGRFDSRRYQRERKEKTHRLLVHTRSALLVSFALSCLVMDVGLLLSPLMTLIFMHFCVQSHELLVMKKTTDDSEKERLGTLWKGFILSNVLTIACDAMALAGWSVTHVYWSSKGIYFLLALMVLVLRLIVHVIALIVACNNLSNIGKTGGGVFVVVFGATVLENARIVGSALSSSLVRRSWTPFQGRGVASGVVNTGDEEETSHVL